MEYLSHGNMWNKNVLVVKTVKRYVTYRCKIENLIYMQL